MKWGQLAQLGFILVAAIGVYGFVRASQNDLERSSCAALCELKPNYAARNRSVPAFTLPNLQGEKVAFASLLGRGPVVLNFWTKSCTPCLEEMPSLAEFATIAADHGVRVVTISTDETAEDVHDTLQTVLLGKPPPFVVLLDPEASVVTDKFGTTLFPETWLIDSDGIIRARIDGARDWSEPLALDVVKMLGYRGGCPIEFVQAKPVGAYAPLCEGA